MNFFLNTIVMVNKEKKICASTLSSASGAHKVTCKKYLTGEKINPLIKDRLDAYMSILIKNGYVK